MREPGSKNEGGWPSGKLGLTLLISFGGLLALMVIAGLDALRLARQMQTQEEEIRQTFLAHSQPLLVLSSSIYVYNDRIQEYLMSQDSQADGLTAAGILAAHGRDQLNGKKISRSLSARRAGVAHEPRTVVHRATEHVESSVVVESRRAPSAGLAPPERRSSSPTLAHPGNIGTNRTLEQSTTGRDRPGDVSKFCRAYKRGKQDCWR